MRVNKKLDETLTKIFSLKPSITRNGERVEICYRGFNITLSKDGDCWINNFAKGCVSINTYKMYKEVCDKMIIDDDFCINTLNMLATTELRIKKLERIVG